MPERDASGWKHGASMSPIIPERSAKTDDRKVILEEAILSAKSDAIIAADREGKIVFWNPGATRIFGHTSAEVLGRSLDVIIPDRLRQRHWDGYRRVMTTGESRYGEGDVLAVPATRKDGSQISVEFTIIFLRTKIGEIVGLAAIMRDVTERFKEMRALKRKLATMPDA
jgi:PAS domain S-box-containing protein